jgi:DNA-binding transcriptional ArsR family regulator
MVAADDLDPVWRALANPVRRVVLDALRGGPRTTGELVELFPDLSRFAVMQHLEVLEEANLLIVRPQGRLRINMLNPVPIRQIYERWVKGYEGLWTGMLTGLKERAEAGPRPRAGKTVTGGGKSNNPGTGSGKARGGRIFNRLPEPNDA